MKPNILFVDDEQNILDSLRVMLHSMRAQWDMNFANGGVEALRLLEEKFYDVVVSDMRMPYMDGSQLLKEIQSRYPETVRMILSGYSEQSSVMRTVKIAHQFLNKPCRPEEFKKSILNALQLRDVLQSKHLKQLISKIESLPVLPQIYNQLMSELTNENSSLHTIGDIICQDVGMSTNLLRLINSAFFGLPTKVTSVHQAVKFLGIETIRALVLTIHLFSTLPQGELPGFSFKLLWEHCSRVSCFAKAIAEVEQLNQSAREDSFIAGILHDVGKLILATTMPESYKEILSTMQNGKLHFHEVEKEILGVTHAEVGAYLLSIWGFKKSIVEAVCWHHTAENILFTEFSQLAAVAVANCFDHQLVSVSAGRSECTLEAPYITKPEYVLRLKGWREICQLMLAKGL